MGSGPRSGRRSASGPSSGGSRRSRWPSGSSSASSGAASSRAGRSPSSGRSCSSTPCSDCCVRSSSTVPPSTVAMPTCRASSHCSASPTWSVRSGSRKANRGGWQGPSALTSVVTLALIWNVWLLHDGRDLFADRAAQTRATIVARDRRSRAGHQPRHRQAARPDDHAPAPGARRVRVAVDGHARRDAVRSVSPTLVERIRAELAAGSAAR